MAKDQERHVCTKNDPYPDAKTTWSEDGYPGGDTQHYKCPNCGLDFGVEIAQ